VDRLRAVQTPRRPPSRLDEHGNRHVAPSWESLVDRQIREAMEAGKFDDLPYRGQRLPMEDESAAGEWAMAFRILRNAGVAPPWIEADKEARALLARRDAILAHAPDATPYRFARLRRELEEAVIEANAAIARLNAQAPSERQHRVPLDLAGELARLEAARRP
jgi:hypothetical protein